MKKRKTAAVDKKTSTELMPPPSAPIKLRKKRNVKVQLPMLVLPDATSEQWVIEKGTFVIRPRSAQDFAAIATSPTM